MLSGSPTHCSSISPVEVDNASLGFPPFDASDECHPLPSRIPSELPRPSSLHEGYDMALQPLPPTRGADGAPWAPSALRYAAVVPFRRLVQVGVCRHRRVEGAGHAAACPPSPPLGNTTPVIPAALTVTPGLGGAFGPDSSSLIPHHEERLPSPVIPDGCQAPPRAPSTSADGLSNLIAWEPDRSLLGSSADPSYLAAAAAAANPLYSSLGAPMLASTTSSAAPDLTCPPPNLHAPRFAAFPQAAGKQAKGAWEATSSTTLGLTTTTAGSGSGAGGEDAASDWCPPSVGSGGVRACFLPQPQHLAKSSTNTSFMSSSKRPLIVAVGAAGSNCVAGAASLNSGTGSSSHAQPSSEEDAAVRHPFERLPEGEGAVVFFNTVLAPTPQKQPPAPATPPTLEAAEMLSHSAYKRLAGAQVRARLLRRRNREGKRRRHGGGAARARIEFVAGSGDERGLLGTPMKASAAATPRSPRLRPCLDPSDGTPTVPWLEGPSVPPSVAALLPESEARLRPVASCASSQRTPSTRSSASLTPRSPNPLADDRHPLPVDDNPAVTFRFAVARRQPGRGRRPARKGISAALVGSPPVSWFSGNPHVGPPCLTLPPPHDRDALSFSASDGSGESLATSSCDDLCSFLHKGAGDALGGRYYFFGDSTTCSASTVATQTTPTHTATTATAPMSTSSHQDIAAQLAECIQ